MSLHMMYNVWCCVQHAMYSAVLVMQMCLGEAFFQSLPTLPQGRGMRACIFQTGGWLLLMAPPPPRQVWVGCFEGKGYRGNVNIPGIRRAD